MVFSRLKMLLAAGALALSAGAASATSVSFDLWSGAGGDVTHNTGNTVTAVSGGITLTVSGRVFSGGINGTGVTSDATAWSNGIGLQRNAWHHDAHFVDGYYDEYLLLTFSTAVDLMSLTFSYADRWDDWRVYSGNFSNFTFQDSGNLTNAGFLQTALVDSDVYGTQFLVGTRGNHSAWKLHGIEVAPIPLPATGLLLLAGLGGLAVMRKRRAVATA
jgi:hypothetical protein